MKLEQNNGKKCNLVRQKLKEYELVKMIKLYDKLWNKAYRKINLL